MANTTLYELLGVSKERADEIAKKVRVSFSDSKTPAEWILRLIEEFHISKEDAEIFACGWFAGKYAGVSEVFNAVQKEMDERELDLAEKRDMENRHPPPDGYA
ncbi:MAG: hypothetical protein PHW87_00070 [Methanothrix sp.]|nr:hypothetical protein [Methanothrix sp.]